MGWWNDLGTKAAEWWEKDYAGDWFGHEVGDPFGEKEAAEKQYKAQQEALNAQERIAQSQMDWLTQRSDMGIGYLGNAGQKAGIALTGAGDTAQGYLAGGMQDAAGALGQGTQQGIGALQGGYGQGRDDLRYGYNQAQRELGSLQGLQDYGGRSARAINAYDVVGRQPTNLEQAYASQQERGLGGFESDPGYQFRQQQGEDAINRAAAARGGRLSGRTLQELSEFNQGLASQEYGNFAQRQMALNQQQLGAAGQIDQGRMGALMNQAGRQDQAALAAQQNQYGLAGIGYGAQNAGAQMAYGYGQQQADAARQLGQSQAGIYGMQGQGLSDLYRGVSGQQAGIAQQTGASMADLLTNIATNKANTAIGTAGNQSSLAQSLMGAYGNFGQYGGMVDQAGANQKKDVAMLAASIWSDRRLKTEIEEIKGSRYERIGLKGYSWRWNKLAQRLFGLTGPSHGVIAQEVETVHPSAVWTSKGYLQVDYVALERLIARAA